MNSTQTTPKIVEIAKLSTDDLEKYIDSRYEANAQQRELNALETVYSERVSEDDLNMTEEDPNMQEDTGEGTHLEENLVDAYRRYLQPDDRRDGRMTKEEVVSFMRAIIEDSRGINKGMKGVTDEEVLAAAKDLYEHRKDLISKYKSKNKFSNIPCNLCGVMTAFSA